MSKSLRRVLSVILLLCMIPATFLSALANGPGVFRDETENQTLDWANGQYIPETIQVDGEYNDTGWPIEGWNYVTSSSGNWNVTDPDATSQQMMYQYQLRADYGYFYGAAVVVLPESINSANFVIYLSDSDDTSGYELTTTAIKFALDNTGNVVQSYTDCNTSDALSPNVTYMVLEKRHVVNANNANVFYLEFSNPVAYTYNADASEIRYYVSLDVTGTESGVINSLYHPIYNTVDGYHAVPTSEFWPGGGNLLTVGYTDVDIRYNDTMYRNDTAMNKDDVDGFKGAIDLDGKFNEEMWKGFTDYYTRDDANLVDFVNEEDKAIVDLSTVNYLGGNVAKYDFRTDDEYFFGALVATQSASDITVGGQIIEAKWTSGVFKYEFKVALSDIPAITDDNVSVTVGSTTYSNLIVNKYDNDASDDVVINGVLDEAIWLPVTAGDNKFNYAISGNGDYGDFELFKGVETLVYDVKSDYEYIYGAAVMQLAEGTEWADEYVRFRLFITPNGDVEGTEARRIVDMYISNYVEGAQFARVTKAENGHDTGNKSYRYSEISEINVDGQTVTLEFKIPYKLMGWEGPAEEAAASGVLAGFQTDMSKKPDEVVFNYFLDVSHYTTGSKEDMRTFFSKDLVDYAGVVEAADDASRANYLKNGTNITYGDMIETVKIDGHIEEDIWTGKTTAGEDVEFYHADFANSTVIDEPARGKVYDYSYMLYGGSNYIYGAVEFNDDAKEGTTFTLWLNNYIDEMKWIGDNDEKTPHITYDVYEKEASVNQYTGEVINGATQLIKENGVGVKVPYVTNEIQYYTNYKYEFDLGKVTAKATPDFYFATDSNLESDKIKIVENENYKYAVTTINGKTYLEFMIDVDNFHWDNNSFEYVTSMTHTVDTTDGATGEQTLTIYHPQINDRSNLWLTNLNTKTSTLPDTNGILYTDASKYTPPPSAHMYAYKFEPVAESLVAGTTDVYTQYRLIEKKSAYTRYYYDGNGEVVKESNNADRIGSAPYYGPEKWQTYTPDESNAGIILFAFYDGQYWVTNHRASSHDNGILTYTNRRPVDYKPVYDTKTQELYYIAANVFDSNSERAKVSNSIMWQWELGDVVEFGRYDGEFIEDKTEDSNVINVSKTQLSDAADLIQYGDMATMHSVFGKEYVNFSDAIKTKTSMLSFGTDADLAFKYKYVTKDTAASPVYDLYEYGKNGTSNYSDTGKGGTAYFGEYTGGNLNDKTVINDSSRAIMYPNYDGEKAVTEIIADLTTAKAANVYTAYIEAGHSGMYADQLNMEIYGSNNEADWDFITSASYRQLILSKGNGYTYSGPAYNSKGETIRNYGQQKISSIELYAGSSNAKLYTSYSDITESLIDGDSHLGYDHQAVASSNWTTGDIIIITNKNVASSKSTFGLDIDLGDEKVIDTVTLGLYDQAKAGIGTPGNVVKVYTSSDKTNWTHETQFTLGRAMTKSHMTGYYKNLARSQSAEYKFDDAVYSRYIRLEFTFSPVTEETNEARVELGWGRDENSSWTFAAFTEVTLAQNVYDYYTLTAVDDKTETYRYIKFRFVDTAGNSVYPSHCFGLGELQISNSGTIENFAKKTILHLNTDQGVTLYNKNGVLQYKGKYNTAGTAWTNDPNDAEYVNHNSISNVVPETILYPNYPLNSIMDTGFYTNYYIERVHTPALEQNDKPVEDTTKNWDGRNSNVLKKLEHVAPDVIAVDGNLNDTGWDGTWTDVDGMINATNTDGTGTDFAYQLRADGEYLYVGAVIELYDDNALEDTTFTLWLKGDDGATTFTHYYKIGTGGTAHNIVLPTPSYENTVESLGYEAVKGVTYGDSKLTFENFLKAAENEDASKPNGDDAVELGYGASALFGYTKEIVENTRAWEWEADQQVKGFRFGIEHGCINSADSKLIGNVAGTDKQAIVEFRVKLSEFGGETGFEYFVEASTTNGTTIYPHIYSESGYTDYHHPAWSWDSTTAMKVTPEDMTGWGIYRMVNDYTPMTSLGAKVHPDYTGDGNLTIRFGARYTEEYIRRISGTEELDYWDVNDAGIVILPTYMVEQGDELAITNGNAVYAGAQDIVNWKNDTADSKTNFADYTSFVFYVNLVGIPETAKNMQFSFCGYVDYYNATQEGDIDNTFYGLPLVRTYDQVWHYANEYTELPNGVTVADFDPIDVTIEYGGNATSYVENEYTYTEQDYVSVLTDGYIPTGTTDKSAANHYRNGYARLFMNSDPKSDVGGTVSFTFEYEREVLFNAVEVGTYIVPSWRVAPPKTVSVYVFEDGEWVLKEDKISICDYDATVMETIGSAEKSERVVLDLKETYKSDKIKLVFDFGEFYHSENIYGDDFTDYKTPLFIGLTEIGLAIN